MPLRRTLQCCQASQNSSKLTTDSPLLMQNCEIHILKYTSPLIYRGEMHFRVQKMGKLQITPMSYFFFLVYTIAKKRKIPFKRIAWKNLPHSLRKSNSRCHGCRGGFHKPQTLRLRQNMDIKRHDEAVLGDEVRPKPKIHRGRRAHHPAHKHGNALACRLG